jgi:ATP-dependent Zn protease
VSIKYVINEAVVNAHFEGKDRIDYKDFTRAREYHEWGLRQPIRSMNLEEKRALAYHETGHAFAMIKLVPSERLSKVTIIRHGSALGLSAPKPLEERHLQTREQLLADMQVSLASKAAEQLFLGSEWTGQFGDLPAATRAATMYMLCGMGGGSLYAPHAFGPINPDGEMKRRIELLLDEQYKKAKLLLGANRETVTAIAEALLIREELDGDEVLEIINEVEDRIARRAAEERERTLVPVGATASATTESTTGNGYGNGAPHTEPNGNGHSHEGNGHGNGNGNGHVDGNGHGGDGNGHSGGYPGATLG